MSGMRVDKVDSTPGNSTAMAIDVDATDEPAKTPLVNPSQDHSQSTQMPGSLVARDSNPVNQHSSDNLPTNFTAEAAARNFSDLLKSADLPSSPYSSRSFASASSYSPYSYSSASSFAARRSQPQTRSQTQQIKYKPPPQRTKREMMELIATDQEVILSHEGSSQYALGAGSSACGLAALNCTRIILGKQKEGVLSDDELIEFILEKSTTEEITTICGLWMSNAHLDVDEIRKTPLFQDTLSFDSTHDSVPSADNFRKLLRKLTPGKSQAIVITRPPEIITCLKIATGKKDVYVIFDSHPRPRYPDGSGLIISTSLDVTANHLASILPYDEALSRDKSMGWQAQLLAQFTAHFFSAKHLTDRKITTPHEIQSSLELSLEILTLRGDKYQLEEKVADLNSEVRNARLEIDALRHRITAGDSDIQRMRDVHAREVDWLKGELTVARRNNAHGAGSQAGSSSSGPVAMVGSFIRSFVTHDRNPSRSHSPSSSSKTFSARDLDDFPPLPVSKPPSPPLTQDEQLSRLKMADEDHLIAASTAIEWRAQQKRDALADAASKRLRKEDSDNKVTMIKVENKHSNKNKANDNDKGKNKDKGKEKQKALDPRGSSNTNRYALLLDDQNAYIDREGFRTFSSYDDAMNLNYLADHFLSTPAPPTNTDTTPTSTPNMRQGLSMDLRALLKRRAESDASHAVAAQPAPALRPESASPRIRLSVKIEPADDINMDQEDDGDDMFSASSTISSEPSTRFSTANDDYASRDGSISDSPLVVSRPLSGDVQQDGFGSCSDGDVSVAHSVINDRSVDTIGDIPPAHPDKVTQNQVAVDWSVQSEKNNVQSDQTGSDYVSGSILFKDDLHISGPRGPRPMTKTIPEPEPDFRLPDSPRPMTPQDDPDDFPDIDDEDEDMRMAALMQAQFDEEDRILREERHLIYDLNDDNDVVNNLPAPLVRTPAPSIVPVASTSSISTSNSLASRNNIGSIPSDFGLDSPTDDFSPLDVVQQQQLFLDANRKAALDQQSAFVDEEARLRKEHEALIREAKAAVFSCGVCLEDQHVDDVFGFDVCSHLLCRNCIRGHVRVKLQDRKYPIYCPMCSLDPECEALGVVDVETVGLASDEEYAIYIELSMATFSVPVHCRKCNSTMNIDKDEHDATNILSCPLPGDCRYRWCKLCNQEAPWGGPEHSCDGTNEFNSLMKTQGWKKCPTCQTPIEKTSGCNHMTCTATGCNTHFCYRCAGIIIATKTVANKKAIDVAVGSHYATTCKLFEYDHIT